MATLEQRVTALEQNTATKDDVRQIVREEIQAAVKPLATKVELQATVKPLQDDVKQLQGVVGDIENGIGEILRRLDNPNGK